MVEADPESVTLERQRVLDLLDDVKGVDAASLGELYPVETAAAPSYEAEQLLGLPLIQGSQLALNEAELAALTAKGFVISDRQSFPSFSYGYESIYGADLPLYVSADSVLDAVHRSYDDILQALELSVLRPELLALLQGMRVRLASGAGSDLGSNAVHDADVFLTVAASLASGESLKVNAGGEPTDESGAEVGRVLHVATGMPRLMVVAVDTCSGPRAYAGLASSYFERTTEQFERLTDEGWAASLRTANPADVSWMSDIVTRQ